MSGDSFVVPIEEIVPSAPARVALRKPQQIIVVTTKSSTTNNGLTSSKTSSKASGMIKTVIIDESFLKQEAAAAEDLYRNGGISREEQSGAVASVLPDQQQGECVLPDDLYEEVVSSEIVHEEVVMDGEEVVEAAGGGGIGSDFFVGHDDDAVIQLKEEEIIETPSSETEMSVAMEMAKLSQQGQAYEEYFANSDSENTTPPPFTTSPPPSGEKPRLSYAQMIAEALMSREDRMLTLSEIYLAIHRRYPYFRMDVKSWQNAIRHNLTLNPSFTKVPRPNNEGRGNYWRMEDGAESVIFKRQIRNHHYNRGRNSVKNTVHVETFEGSVVYPQETSTGGQTFHIIQQSPQQQQTTTVLQNIEQHHIVQQNGSIVFIALPSSVKT